MIATTIKPSRNDSFFKNLCHRESGTIGEAILPYYFTESFVVFLSAILSEVAKSANALWRKQSVIRNSFRSDLTLVFLLALLLSCSLALLLSCSLVILLSYPAKQPASGGLYSVLSALRLLPSVFILRSLFPTLCPSICLPFPHFSHFTNFTHSFDAESFLTLPFSHI